jgi:CPA1 family monovalent cation:H+ antiporter
MSWPAAFVLGAIVSPPDAIAATAVTSRLRVPRRIITILEGESLVNDAAALVAYRIGIAVALGTEQFSFGKATGWFFVAAVGGVAVGLAAGWLVAWMRPRIHDAAVESTISLLTPYIAYLPAEWFHVSGVLAVVTTGIYLSRKLPQVTSPRVRLRAYAIWEAVVFMLNGIIFILIGLQLPTILRALKETTSINLVGVAAIIGGVCIAARFLWIFPATYIPRRLFPKLADRYPLPSWRALLVIGWAGMRGIVSLAAALALPAGFPHRDLILFITFGVILATLVVQGLTLPPLIRAMKLPADSDGEDEETTARYLSALAAIEWLDRLIASTSVAATEQAAGIARLRAEYDERVAYYSRRLAPVGETADGANGIGDGVGEACTISLNVRREAITAERQMLVRLRDQGVIGDEALRAVQEELDLEESRFE